MIKYKNLSRSLLTIIFILSFSVSTAINKNESQHYYLDLLKIKQSTRSIDYVNNKKQFQLHTLITEQSHLATSNLSETAKRNPALATKMLLTADHDIRKKIFSLKNDRRMTVNINQAIMAVKWSILHGNKVYIYGTGSTGRLAKQIENIWYSFWQKTKARKDWPEIANHLKDIQNLDNIQNLVIGEITGGDRALIKSLEGFEDLQLIGKLQLEDNHINSHDIVFAVTEGGETSAVIGTILAANKLPESHKDNLFFVYNNPNNVLMPFDRSREVLINPKITKINFTTGNQGITGSTRMQATSSQTFLISSIIEQALAEILHNKLSTSEFHNLGFNSNIYIATRLKQFNLLQTDVEKERKTITDIANLEYQAYKTGNHAIYFGNQLLTTLFIDITERAPTFNLSPLDAKGSPSLSWVKVYTEAANNNEGWHKLLGRDFIGLDKTRYKPSFESNITDPYLKTIALASLEKAGYNQKFLYDLSANNLNPKTLKPGDIGIAYLFVDEAIQLTDEPKSNFKKWLDKLGQHKIIVVLVGLANQKQQFKEAINKLKQQNKNITIKQLALTANSDPLHIKQIIASKLFLNTQSTLIMARLERVLGNSMIYVYPSNLKLTGRATYLIQIHINQILAAKSKSRNSKFKHMPPISYNDANAILFAACKYIEDNKKRDKVAVIPLAIVSVFEALQKKPSDFAAAEKILVKHSLSEYVNSL
jgi:N-acetylmuramic acid 6-phosphate etherase